MIHVISSNRVEVLQQELAGLLRSSPLADPFKAEQIIVPGMAMARWLNLELAASHDIAANINFALPAAWIWELASRQLGSDLGLQTPGDGVLHDPLSRDALVWRVYQLLPELLGLPAFLSLRDYLEGDTEGVRRWQLSLRIADVFDRYQYYRPDWIRLWSRKEREGQDWQQLLWQHLIADLPHWHRVAAVDQLRAVLHGNEKVHDLPERVSCFALSSLPPLHVEILKSLSRHMEVILFLHSPTDQYWADIKSKKQLSRLRVQRAELPGYHDTGNELLASWGRQGQAFQDLLLDSDTVEAAEWEDYQTPGTETLLQRIQSAIFQLEEEEAAVVPADESVTVSICHSALRECQVLHDELLRTMQNDSTLRPEDVLVMVPQISDYAPYIEAVFSHEESGSRPFIPWNLSDLSMADEHPLIGMFFQLLSLPDSRFTRSEILSCLEVPEITARFGLDRKTCEEMSTLLESTHVHWGLDAGHKQELGLPAMDQNTWRQAEDRLLLTYAMGNRSTEDEEETGESDPFLWQGIATTEDIDGTLAVKLGRFLALIAEMRKWRYLLGQERTGREWQRVLNGLLEAFFLEQGEESDRLQQIRDAVDVVGEQAGDVRLSRRLLEAFLQESLGSREGRNHFFSGGVTFCGMRPMRSLPFRFICVLGLQDTAFPRREQPIEFDLMAQQWRPGDPRKGDEDRYLLLETLLCAREKLYFSYTGRSLKDNSPCQPSILLAELMDFIDLNYRPEGAEGKLMSEAISRVHTMQAFDHRNFIARSGPGSPFSHDRYWCHVARKMLDRTQNSAEKTAEIPVAAEADSQPGESGDALERVELQKLQRFLREPVAEFFRKRLGIYLPDTEQNEDEEVFELDGLRNWRIKQRLLDHFGAGRQQSLAMLEAEGLLPHGSQAGRVLDVAWVETEALRGTLENYSNITPLMRQIELPLLEKYLLTGQVKGYPGLGSLHVTPSKLKGKTVLRAWVEHLALCGAGLLESEEGTYLYCQDRAIRFPRIDIAEARQQLEDYLDIYRVGHQAPLPIFPQSSHEWACDFHNNSDTVKADAMALKAWIRDYPVQASGDGDDPYVQLALRGRLESPVPGEEFRELAWRLYQKMLACQEEI